MAKDFLTICNEVARESGTVTTRPGANIIDVATATGRQAKIVGWVRMAWVMIQTARSEPWPWMIGEFSKSMVIGQSRYVGGAGGFALPRFSRFVVDRQTQDETYLPFSIYDPAIGVADECAITRCDLSFWKQTYSRGVQTNSRPTEYAIDRNGDLLIGRAPDKAFTIKGEYVKAPQRLAANGDIPEIPEAYEDIILYRALELLGEHDEAANQIATARREWQAIHYDMVNATAGRMG